MFIPFLLVIGEHNCPVLIDQPGKGKVFSTVNSYNLQNEFTQKGQKLSAV